MEHDTGKAIKYHEQLAAYLVSRPDKTYLGKVRNLAARDMCMIAAQALREKLEREQQLDGWIKFSDRMPDTDCIVYEANSGRVLYAVHSEWEATDWYCTHWMPLPEPPEK